ncbi:MAG: alkaline phosphatase family protein [Acidobacteria bacterium]|nr:alkaline phosphatase family protein [Acidobacteriota bacterium]
MMKRLLGCAVAVWMVCAGCSARAEKVDRSRPMVVVISLDAFGAESLRDGRLSFPTLRMLMKQGSYARAMQPVNPTVTWPNHTAIVTGVDSSKSFIMANGLITHQQDPTIEPKVLFPSTKAELVHVPTVYDVVHQAGMTTAEVDWVAIHDPKTIDFAFEERPDANSVVVKEMIADGLITPEQVANFRKPDQTWRDQMYTNAAVHIIKRHHPNLLLLHYLTLDSMEHRYGFSNPATAAAISFLDAQVKQVVDAVKEAGDLDRTTFLIVSDHGQMSVHARVLPALLLKHAGFTPQDAGVLPEAGLAYIYAHHPDAAKLAKLKAAFEGKEGIRSVVTPDGYAAIGIADPKVNPQAPDLIVFAANGYALTNSDGDITPKKQTVMTGSHGYPNTEPLMQEIFIASGRGIKNAGEIPAFKNLNVAPTIAQLLGVQMKNIDGVPVTAALK